MEPFTRVPMTMAAVAAMTALLSMGMAYNAVAAWTDTADVPTAPMAGLAAPGMAGLMIAAPGGRRPGS